MTTKEIEKNIEKKIKKKCSDFTDLDWTEVGYLHIMNRLELNEEFLEKYWGKVRSCFLFVYMEASGEFIERYKSFLFYDTSDDSFDRLILSQSNAQKWLKYRMEIKKISEEEYLKKLLIIKKRGRSDGRAGSDGWNDVNFDMWGELIQ